MTLNEIELTAMKLTSGQRHDLFPAKELVEEVLQSPDPPHMITGDKGYDAPSFREWMLKKKLVANIASRVHTSKTEPKKEVVNKEFVKTEYINRNRVERFIQKIKEFRRVATRYDKLAVVFASFITLAATLVFLRHKHF